MDIDIVTVHNINIVILSTHMMGLITINTGMNYTIHHKLLLKSLNVQ